MSSKPHQNILIMSCGFLLTFCAFATTEALETTTNGENGAISLAILYAVFTFSNLFIPIVLNVWTPKKAMICGACFYAIYIGSNIYVVNAVFYIASFMLGLGAAMIWIAQSVYLTQCANQYELNNNLPLNSKLGYFNGIFYLFKKMSVFIGYSILSILLLFDDTNVSSYQYIYAILTLIAIFGVITFSFIESRSEEALVDSHYVELAESKTLNSSRATSSDQTKMPSERVDCNSTLDNLRGAIKLWSNRDLQNTLFLIFYSGTYHVFEYGYFPVLISDKQRKFWALAMFGLFDAISSLLMGKISDTIGKIPILSFGAACHLIVYIVLLLSDAKQFQFVWFLLSSLLGIGNGCFGTQINALLPILLPNAPKADIFANAKFFKELSVSITFGLYPYLTNMHQLIFNMTLLAIAFVFIFGSKNIRTSSRPRYTKVECH